MNTSDLPAGACDYVVAQLVGNRAILCLRVLNDHQRASVFSGRANHFGMSADEDGIVDIAWVCLGPERPENGLLMSRAQIGSSVKFDLHQLALSDGLYVFLIDVDGAAQEIQQLQQKSNESRLELTRAVERERILQNEQAELRKHQHMQSEFVRRLSHEFGSPISAVLGHLDLIDVASTDADQVHRSMTAVRRGIVHVRQLVESVLDQARLENNQFELHPMVCNLQSLADDFRELYAAKAFNRGVDWRVDLSANGCVDVLVDELRLRQVLINLITNAFKFTEQGRINLSLRWDGGCLRGEICDTGPGMDAAQQERLFTDYGRSAQGVRGTGLGLSISKEITQRMGGYLRLKSTTLGTGSCFEVQVPAPIVRGKPAQRVLATQPRVLVIDDDEELRILLTAMLEFVGCESSALSALEEIDADTVRPDIAVVDMHLGEVDGGTVIKHLRARWPDTYVLALSADSSQDVLERSRSAGADSFLLKPVDIGALSMALQVFEQRTPTSQLDP